MRKYVRWLYRTSTSTLVWSAGSSSKDEERPPSPTLTACNAAISCSWISMMGERIACRTPMRSVPSRLSGMSSSISLSADHRHIARWCEEMSQSQLFSSSNRCIRWKHLFSSWRLWRGLSSRVILQRDPYRSHGLIISSMSLSLGSWDWITWRRQTTSMSRCMPWPISLA